MIADLLVELIYVGYFAINRRVDFDPINGFIFTLILFITTLNVSNFFQVYNLYISNFSNLNINILQIYCILCVISQYQLYKVGNYLGNERANVCTILFYIFRIKYEITNPVKNHISLLCI